jgi:hypothetical protein
MKTKLGLNVLMAIVLFLFSVSFLAASGAAASGEVDRESILKAYGKLPLCFIENKGQIDSKVRFYVKASGQTLYFTEEGIVFDLLRRENTAWKGTKGPEKGRNTPGAKTERLVFNLGFENARKGVLIEGLDRQDGGINFFVGNDRSRWKTGIPTYKGIVYKGVYKGIDLKVFGNGKDIEYEFIVNPGGNPDDILLTYNGIRGLAKNGEGELLIATAFGELKETKPYIYQEIEGERTVDGRFEIRSPAGQSQTGKFSYGFQVASYDPSYPLIIDPVLTYSTYLGGTNGDDVGLDIAVDTSGNAYVTGYTYSTDFPLQSAYQGTIAGSSDAFITKLSSDGSALTYSTYLGGTDFDFGYGIAVDTSGNAYVTGYTYSTDFPLQSAYQGTIAGSSDAFITKLSSDGSALTYSTYLGGTDFDFGYGIAVDTSNNAYVTGNTTSSQAVTNPFPLLNAYQSVYGGGTDPFFGSGDAFITKLSSDGSALTYSTYLGGTGSDFGYGIAVDTSNSAYVTGYTTSTDFPLQSAYQGALAGSSDAFITKLSPAGNTLSYSTYLGGTDNDTGYAIALDVSNDAYVTGETRSNNFPTSGPFQAKVGGLTDAFVTKLSSDGSALTYSTYLGGSESDSGSGIAVDASGSAYVAGYTSSGNFPMQSPVQAAFAGWSDAFITKLSPAGSALTYSTYLGGSESDYANGIALHPTSDFAYVTGLTYSTNFPMQNPFQPNNVDSSDAFVTKLSGEATLPTVTTQAVTGITGSSATSGGNVTSDGGETVTARGVCWSTSANPTTADSKTVDGSGTGSFISTMTGIMPGKAYHVRAYATNSAGTGYGSDIPFSGMTLPPCSQCTGDPVFLTNVIFPSGTACECVDATSITVGPNVTIENGAIIVFRAPIIDLKPGVNIQPGAVVNMRQE